MPRSFGEASAESVFDLCKSEGEDLNAKSGNNGLPPSPGRAKLLALDLTAARLAAASSPTSPHV